MINILDICDSANVVKIIYYMKVIVTIITIAVPIILVLSCMISAVRAVVSNDTNALSTMFNAWVKKVIAAILIFYIPTIVFTLIDIVDGDSNVKGCYQSATLNRAENLEKSENSSKEAQIAKWKQEQEEKKKIEDEKRRQMREEKKRKKQERKRQNQSSAPSPYNTYYVSNGNYTGAGKIVTVNLTDLGCPVTYADTPMKSFGVHEAVASEVHSILTKWCSGFVNKNQSLTNRIETAGAYVNKAGYHGRGLAIDFYNNWKYTENGKTYTPYAGQGTDTWYRYNNFICEVCNGQENCSKNIAYKMYYDYFKTIGWCWGGNWTAGYFDPMHYEKTDGGCSAIKGNRISCN